jgi:hypothetical protein
VLLGKSRALQNSPLSVAQTGSSANPTFPALLGCVKWPIKHFITVNNAKTLLGVVV